MAALRIPVVLPELVLKMKLVTRLRATAPQAWVGQIRIPRIVRPLFAPKINGCLIMLAKPVPVALRVVLDNLQPATIVCALMLTNALPTWTTATPTLCVRTRTAALLALVTMATLAMENLALTITNALTTHTTAMSTLRARTPTVATLALAMLATLATDFRALMQMNAPTILTHATPMLHAQTPMAATRALATMASLAMENPVRILMAVLAKIVVLALVWTGQLLDLVIHVCVILHSTLRSSWCQIPMLHAWTLIDALMWIVCTVPVWTTCPQALASTACALLVMNMIPTLVFVSILMVVLMLHALTMAYVKTFLHQLKVIHAVVLLAPASARKDLWMMVLGYVWIMMPVRPVHVVTVVGTSLLQAWAFNAPTPRSHLFMACRISS
jgi:hypothetical protein